jgi:hypothetical protein
LLPLPKHSAELGQEDPESLGFTPSAIGSAQFAQPLLSLPKHSAELGQEDEDTESLGFTPSAVGSAEFAADFSSSKLQVVEEDLAAIHAARAAKAVRWARLGA